MRRYCVVLACSFLVVLAASAEAQQGSSSIRGRIVDQQGAVLPGVAVIVTHQESGTFRETVTAPDGTYFIAGIVPGPYQVSAALEGFRKLTRDVRLEIGATLTVDLSLEVGALTEVVTVTSEAPQVDLTSPQVGGNVSSGELTDLPSLTRNFTGLVALLPGVVYNPAADGNSDSVTINGQHGSGVVYLMDGGSNNDDLRGGSSGAQARTPLEAIQEFQVITNQFDAEYGAAVAGVVNAVTKQGTNAFRGSVIGYFTDKSITAEDFFVEQQGLEKPDTKKQQWGGTIGGPIVRDKMHFFFSFERQDRREGRSRVYPTRPDRSFTAAQQSNYWNYMGRVDHQLNSSHNYSVRYLIDHQPSINQVLNGGGSTANLPGTIDTMSIERDNDWSLVGNYNWVVGPSKFNTLRVSHVYEKPKRGQPLYQDTGDWTQAPPTLQYVNFIDQADDNYADFRIMKTYALDETFSWFKPSARGNHDLKMGAQYQYGEHYREDQRVTNGRFIFPSDRAFNAADPFTYPERLNIRAPQMVDALSKTHTLGTFVQDKWQLNRNFTLTLGVRYDIHISPIRNYWNPFFDDPNEYPTDTNNIQPRAGFAYSMADGGAVLRGGYGMFYEKQYVDRFENYLLNRTFSSSFIAEFPVSDVDPGPSAGQFPTNPFLVNGPVLNRSLVDQLVPPGTLARNTSTVWLDTPDRILPMQHQGSIGYERQLGQQLSFAADYVHMSNRNMPLRYNLNPGIKANTGRTTPLVRTDIQGIANELGLSPFRGDVFIVEYNAETEYDGLNMQIEKRFSNYWGARVSYGLGYGRGNTSLSSAATPANEFQVLEERNLDQNEGPTNLDRRHTVTLSGRFEIPWVPGLTLATITRFMSGQPLTIHNTNVDANRNGVGLDPLPAGTYSGQGQNAITVENKGGRNGAYGPGFAQLDMRAGYRLRPGAGRTLDLFLEVFNLTNEANFANPTGDMRSANFLIPTSLLGGGFPRQLQVGMRLGF
jgi:Carboxypeptidase regulatory-like domain/TonB dependent receptor/TonB-dependent Receptor Plug Domain